MKREQSTKEKLLADFGGMGLEAGARSKLKMPSLPSILDQPTSSLTRSNMGSLME